MEVRKFFRRLILWDYQRGVWQYDIICGVILLFIFGSHREWFRDQPIIPNVAEITSMPAHQGESAFWIEPQLITSIPENKRDQEISKILTVRTRKRYTVTRIDTIYDSEQSVIGYLAYAKP